VLIPLRPLAVWTLTSTTPIPGGELVKMRVSSATKKFRTGTVPNWTVVAPVNPVPKIATAVAPAEVPECGSTAPTTGAVVTAFAKVMPLRFPTVARSTDVRTMTARRAAIP
jgi:hypothetical protein